MTPAGLAPGDPSADPEHRPSAPSSAPGDTSADTSADTAAEELLGSADPGPLLAAGDSADVFAVDDKLVLRRYREGRDATSEAAMVRHVVAHGYPAPAVYAAAGSDIVMERLHGPTLLQSLAAGETSIHDAAALLADLHARLHALPVPEDWDGPTSQSWPESMAGTVVVHLDLHPANVILTETHGAAVVDWCNTRIGTAELDVAISALIISEVAVDAGGVYSQAARALLAALLSAVDVDVIGALDEAATLRSQDPTLVVGERGLVPVAATLVRELIEVSARS
ncbi:phosphotransferase [Cellulomonas rhizosphaerae]|uniref:Aminoglycoside phosphotransferase family protein n=1 Tax=Cellulomonas rhizosphaerae TaxID=2293719 RepID=A0A413RR54_9CELL|nr:phosphotransferase [Cellulomonas rhizosphaerae]RHA44424.1 aminoglycoside phosphotransferase family protein [Cellulomonas rhizosphaerae]